MIYHTNDCVDCGLPCVYELCPYYKALHSKCDFCKEEDIRLYNYEGYEICQECLLKQFDVVYGSDCWD